MAAATSTTYASNGGCTETQSRRRCDGRRSSDSVTTPTAAAADTARVRRTRRGRDANTGYAGPTVSRGTSWTEMTQRTIGALVKKA